MVGVEHPDEENVLGVVRDVEDQPSEGDVVRGCAPRDGVRCRPDVAVELPVLEHRRHLSRARFSRIERSWAVPCRRGRVHDGWHDVAGDGA